jgi:hypothetical protein
MASVRAAVTRLMSVGALSAGWYSLLTGAAMLYLAYLLGTAAGDDPAAPYVAIVLAVTGIWQVERGVRAELRQRTKSTGEPS